MSAPLNLHAGTPTAVTYGGYTVLAVFEGVPTASVPGYAKGCLAIDVTNGNYYRNSGTAASATWTQQTT
jgi:hypothetical protein